MRLALGVSEPSTKQRQIFFASKRIVGSMSADQPVRFGVMCDGPVLDDWMARCVHNLLDLESTSLELLVIDDRHSGSSTTQNNDPKIIKFWDTLKNKGIGTTINQTALFFQKYSQRDFRSRESVDMSADFEDIPRVNCSVRTEGYSEYFREDDLSAINSYDVDFLLRFSFGIIRGEILDIPTYGVWSFHHDDERKYRGGPPCYREIVKGDPITGSILQRLTDRLDGGIVLKRGNFRTESYWPENLDKAYYGSATWPAQVVTDIVNGNAEYIDASASKTDAPIYGHPNAVDVLLYYLRRIEDIGKGILRGRNIWNFGVVETDWDTFRSNPIDTEIEVNWFGGLQSGSFLADPFPCEIDGEQYIFFEDFSFKKEKAKISYVQYPDGFATHDTRTALREPFHLSYPYLFSHKGTTYAVPETLEANEIRLYKVNSPSDWELHDTLITDISGADPTVFYHKGRWWLLCTKVDDCPQSRLYVWYADSLQGDWTPHANNPVKTDIRSARPAGMPWTADEQLYRPAQYSANYYGERLAINRVDTLSPVQFKESTVCYYRPSQDSEFDAGTHTLTTKDGLTVIDGFRFSRVNI